MGKFLQTSLAMMIVFTIAGLFTSAIYWGSDDPDKEVFVLYNSSYHTQTGDILTEGNETFSDGDNLNLNFEKIGQNIEMDIKNAQVGLQSQDAIQMITSAFGLVASLTMNAFFALLAVILQGLNLVGGVIGNLSSLPTPWNAIGMVVAGLVPVMLLIYLVFKLISAHKGYNL